MKTGIITDPVFQRHNTGAGHPECPSRLSATDDFISQQIWFQNLKILGPSAVDNKWLSLVHDEDYLERARFHCEQGNEYLDSPDVSICNESWKVATLAAGSVLNLADQIMENQLDNGFAMIRPPGHHAEHNMALGFCLINNVAILARYLQEKHGLEKILILDWDVHHGNGTQHVFESDPSILFISTHQYPYYPGTGSYSETGQGAGSGATVNCPMFAGYGDKEYEQAFIETIFPKIHEFKPDFLIISAGFDAHFSDPLGQINLSTEFYGWMTERVMELAAQYCQNRIISVLEGGYNLHYLPLCITEHLAHLCRYHIAQETP